MIVTEVKLICDICRRVSEAIAGRNSDSIRGHLPGWSFNRATQQDLCPNCTSLDPHTHAE